MEDSGTEKGVFFDTKKLDSELMVRCLQAILNDLPNFQFTCIRSDETFFGYRVYFSSPDEESVLETEPKVSGQTIRICPLKTFLSIQILNKTKENLSKSDIEHAIGDRFGKLLGISYVPGICQNENIHVIADIPEIKAQEKFQESRSIILTIPNKTSQLKISLGCMLCKKDDHIAGDCNQVSVAVGRQASNDGESVLADSTMKVDFNIESTEAYAEKIGREEIMKTKYFSIYSSPGNKRTTEIKEIKKEPEFYSSAGVSGQNSTVISNIQSKSNSDEDEDEDIQILSSPPYPDNQPLKFRVKTEPAVTDEAASTDKESNPVPSDKKRKSQVSQIAVEDMSVLSKSLQECIDNACNKFAIIGRNRLQAFFYHVKKKSNVIEVASKFVSDVSKLKELLKHVSKSYYNTTQTGTKEDKRFIKWLDERTEKFDRKVPQKRKRTSQDDSKAKKSH